jgi:isopenicillin N synthase-like dioxygenase
LNGGGDWIDVPPVAGAFTVNISDMMKILSNGIFVATTHRVRKTAQERYSFPLFFTLDYQTRIEPLPGLVTVDRPARPGLISAEHLFAQTVQSFTYQKKRLARGKTALPEGVLAPLSFGYTARHEEP